MINPKFKRTFLMLSLLSSTLVACATAQTFIPLGQQGQQLSSLSSPALGTASTDPNSYYAPSKGLSGAALFKSLHQIIEKNHRTPSYGSARSFLYGSADQVQIKNKSGLIASYSELFLPGSGGNGNRYRENGDQNADGLQGDFINCEHTWPQSFFNKKQPMVADMHHLFPTLSKPNSMRNNHPIGMASGVVVYTTTGGAKLGVIDKTGKHNPADIKRWYNMPWNQQPHDIMRRDLQAVFEPPNSQKGNTARAMLYFFLRYYDQNIRNGAYQDDVYWKQQVRTYISWSKADPVDAQERQRHDMIARKQNNRNPFVDMPDLAERIGEAVLVNGPGR